MDNPFYWEKAPVQGPGLFRPWPGAEIARYFAVPGTQMGPMCVDISHPPDKQVSHLGARIVAYHSASSIDKGPGRAEFREIGSK